MAVLVDQRLEVDEAFSSAINGQLVVHTTHPLLAIGAFDQDKGGIVNVFFDDGTRIPSDIAPKPGVQATTLSWHPFRKLLAMGWENGELSLWDETDHSTKEAQTKHKRAVAVTCWSPNGMQLVSADVIGSCTGWQIDSQGALSVMFHHELSTSISGIVYRVPYNPIKHADANNLSVRTHLNGEDAEFKVTSREPKTQLKESLSFFVGSLSGMVFYVSEGGSCTDILQMEGAIKSILHYSSKDILILVTEMLILAQFKISDDGSVTEKSKIKLSGQNPDVIVNWAGNEILAVCTGEKVLRLWNMESGQNCVLTLEGQGYKTAEVMTCMAYEPSKSILAAGTSHGHVATWRFTGMTDTYGRHAMQEEDWSTQPSIHVQGNVKALAWGTNKQILGVITVTDAYIFSEQKMCCSFCDQTAAVQISARHINIELFSTNKALDLSTDVHVQQIFVSADHVAISNGKRLLFYELNRDALSSKFIGSFNTESQCIVLKDKRAFVIEGKKIEAKAYDGSLKQTLSFPEEEGRPLSMHLSGQFLTVTTTIGCIRIWDVSSREAKLHSGPKLFDFILKDKPGASIYLAKCNCLANKVGFMLANNNGKTLTIYSHIYLWDIETGVTFCFDVDQGRFGDTRDKRLEILSQCETSEMSELLRGRHPLSMFWDPEDPRLLICTLKLSIIGTSDLTEKKHTERRVRIKRSSSSQTFRWEQKPAITVISMFFNSEQGLLIQDIFPLKDEQVDLVAVQIPFYYVQQKSGDLTSSENSESAQINLPKVTGFVKPLTMRDFTGLEECDKTTREAVMDFSFYLTSNNMDEAFRAIKTIKNQSVWDNMAKMCVKTKRLDVATVCLGKMENARGAKALREAASIPQLEAKVAVLAIHLGMTSEAERLLKACCRYDLLNKLYQDTGQWSKALEIAEIHDRIHRRSTYYNYAQYLEYKGEVTAAIPVYEKSETHHFEVPRMLFEEPRALEAYVLKSKDNELLKWWAQYMESIGEMETALQYYEAAKDYLSLVRVYCYCSNLEKAAEIANETGDKAACFHLGRQFENQENINEAVHFFTRAQAYNNAIRICKEHGLDDQLFNLALMSGSSQIIDVARYYEDRPNHQDKAVKLYHKAGCITKAVELAFKNREYGALHHIVSDLNKDTDPKLLQKCARFFTDNNQFDKAVNLLATSGQYMEALELCLEKNITLSEELAEKMTMSKEEGDSKLRSRVLDKIGEICMLQENYHLAAKKYTQSGNKAQAMRALLKSGDTEKIVFFAGVSRSREIYIMAANYLQSLDWRQNPEIMKQIIGFYTKGKAMDLLAGFYDACAQVEIDEYQNYEKALGALNESLKCLTKSEESNENRQLQLKRKTELVKKFVQARNAFDTNAEEALNQCRSLLAETDCEMAVRRGDIYGYLVERYAQAENYKIAYSLIEEMRTRIRGATLTYYIAPDVLKTIFKALNLKPSKDTEEKKEGESDEDVPEEFVETGY